ncbi:hypothetical protein NX774_03840 [Massilia agilis]|uniref:Uncharacterized protein n=1 Tax=Massilia agilis TaxID=1811226 RepID=A0ABT2D6Y8_9BURK|nr:hypothetical protein [Massilia agilis]MCS0807050.1 hypothetical protein [Massilia agilis]
MESELQHEVFAALGAERIARVRLITHLHRLSWVAGVVSAIVVGALTKEPVFFVLTGLAVGAGLHLYTENVLLAQVCRGARYSKSTSLVTSVAALHYNWRNRKL